MVEAGILTAWERLDPDGPPDAVWLRRPDNDRVVVLLGAFDPPTNAHIAVITAAARVEGAAGVLCLTKTLLARSADELLGAAARLRVLDSLARESNLGLAIANRGTYVDVAEAFRSSGCDASFVIGSDKLAQLEDPSFYPDAERGVARTFTEVAFLVVPRPEKTGDRRELRWLDPAEVFSDPDEQALSATEVRQRFRAGEDVRHLVPRTVGVALEGYTSAK